MEKHILSCGDLKRHSAAVHVYTPSDIVNALDRDGFDAVIENPATNDEKRILDKMGDLICFGSDEVR